MKFELFKKSKKAAPPAGLWKQVATATGIEPPTHREELKVVAKDYVHATKKIQLASLTLISKRHKPFNR